MSGKKTNGEIVEIYLKSGLIGKCVECQFAKFKDNYDKQNQDDFYQDLVLILLEYDNVKMNHAHANGHMNALITKMIVNNIFSKTSPYYKQYKKYSTKAEEITKEIIENYTDEE